MADAPVWTISAGPGGPIGPPGPQGPPGPDVTMAVDNLLVDVDELKTDVPALSAALSTQVGRTAYNAKDYELVGDGVTADQAEATAMWSEIPVGARLHFPRGEYLLSGANLPPAKLEVVGDGAGATTLKVANGATLPGGLLQWTNGIDVCVRDLTIDLNKAGTPDGGADGAQMGVYFYTGPAGASRRNRVERVRVLNGERHGIVVGAAAAGLPTEVDLIDVDVEDCDSIGAFISYLTRGKVRGGNYLRNGLDNIQFLRSAGFTVEDVAALGSLGGHGVTAGDLCSEFKFLGGKANDNALSGWVASVRCTAFQMLGQRADSNGQLGITVDVRNHDTTLTAGINAVTQTIPVASTADLVAPGVITIGTERIFYPDLTFTGCTRGYDSTAAAAHLSGAVVHNEVFHLTDGVVSDYLLSGNGLHGLYYQFGTDLSIGPGVSRNNVGDGALIVAKRAAIVGLHAYGNAGRGLGLEDDAFGSPTGGHRIGVSPLHDNVGLDYQDNADDPSTIDLGWVG